MTRNRLEEIKAGLEISLCEHGLQDADLVSELLAHAEATIPPEAEAPPEIRFPRVGEIWRDPARRGYGGGKFEVTERSIALSDLARWEFVCDKPHGDGDFSYLCNWSECRCHQ